MKLLLFLVAQAALAVTISDTIRLPDGSTPSGRLTIILSKGTASSSQTYAASRQTVTVTNGVVSVSLAANTTLTPAGTYYRVEYFLQGGNQQVEYWLVPAGGPYTIREVRWRDREPKGYSATFSGTTWSVPASVHGIRSTGMTVDCFDTSGNQIDCAVTVNPITYDVAARFTNTQAGRLQLNAVSAWSTQNYVKPITSATSVGIPYSEHRFATGQIRAQCFDSSGNDIVCEPTVNQSTYAVTVAFAVAQSGWIVLSGR